MEEKKQPEKKLVMIGIKRGRKPWEKKISGSIGHRKISIGNFVMLGCAGVSGAESGKKMRRIQSAILHMSKISGISFDKLWREFKEKTESSDIEYKSVLSDMNMRYNINLQRGD